MENIQWKKWLQFSMFACLKIGNDSCQFWWTVQQIENINSMWYQMTCAGLPIFACSEHICWSTWQNYKTYFVFFWDKKIVIDEGNAWGRMGVNLEKNNLSIYFFQYIEYIDIFLLIYRTYRYILGNISIYLFRIAIPMHAHST